MKRASIKQYAARQNFPDLLDTLQIKYIIQR